MDMDFVKFCAPVEEFTPEEFNPENNNTTELEAMPNVFESKPEFVEQQEVVENVQPNPNQFSSVFVNKETEIVPPMDLPKLNEEVTNMEENEIKMPEASTPRPFDIEDRDL